MSQNYDDDILIYAFRYALGRMTYAVGIVANAIQECAESGALSLRARTLFIKEINAAYSQNELGMEMDMKVWLRLRDLLAKQEPTANPAPPQGTDGSQI